MDRHLIGASFPPVVLSPVRLHRPPTIPGPPLCSLPVPASPGHGHAQCAGTIHIGARGGFVVASTEWSGLTPCLSVSFSLCMASAPSIEGWRVNCLAASRQSTDFVALLVGNRSCHKPSQSSPSPSSGNQFTTGFANRFQSTPSSGEFASSVLSAATGRSLDR